MSEINYEELHKELVKQEESLQFKSFTNETALEIGLSLVKKAKELNRPITIDITKNRQQIFHYSFEGTSLDNDNWVIRKNNTVYRFNKSSYHIGTLLNVLGKTLEEKFYISSLEYATHGGAFPIIIKDVGVIGTITVSGMTQDEDHKLVVNTISEYLGLK
jgi:uncharacterized protein (UPF0303 family)